MPAELKEGMRLSVEDIPAADRLLCSALPIVHWHAEFPGIGGTCFPVRWRGAVVFLTAGHVVASSRASDVRVITRFAGGGHMVEIRDIERPGVKDPEDPDWLDFAILVPKQGTLDESYDVANEDVSFVDFNRVSQSGLFAAAGYPLAMGRVDYASVAIDNGCFITPAKYVGRASSSHCHTITMDEAVPGTPDGMSGGPVVALALDDGEWHVALAGMLLRGGAKRFHFLDAKVLCSALSEWSSMPTR